MVNANDDIFLRESIDGQSGRQSLLWQIGYWKERILQQAPAPARETMSTLPVLAQAIDDWQAVLSALF
jgi:hypothetical protein